MSGSRSSNDSALVADIGGTHARFAIVGAAGMAPRPLVKVACAEHADLRSAISQQLDAMPRELRPRRAALAVAAVVASDSVCLTNLKWQFSIEGLKKELALEELMVLNDFEALAWSLPNLQGSEVQQVGPGTPQARGPRAVIGPGTGLGVSGLIPCRGGWAAIRGEGGHVSFSPSTERESAILACVWKRFAHASTERLVSGIGLPMLHMAVCQVDGHACEPLSVEEIARRAQQGSDAGCAATIDAFCAMLGTAAGNLALTLGATGGVYIGGGIVPRLGECFDRSEFRCRFESKGRFAAHNAGIPTYKILAEHPALIGAAAALNDATDGAPGHGAPAPAARPSRQAMQEAR